MHGLTFLPLLHPVALRSLTLTRKFYPAGHDVLLKCVIHAGRRDGSNEKGSTFDTISASATGQGRSRRNCTWSNKENRCNGYGSLSSAPYGWIYTGGWQRLRKKTRYWQKTAGGSRREKIDEKNRAVTRCEPRPPSRKRPDK